MNGASVPKPDRFMKTSAWISHSVPTMTQR